MEPDFNAPIPGQSLTEEPGKYPWDRPSESADPKKVLKSYMNNLNKEEVMDGLLTLVEAGVPIKDLTLGLLRIGVSEGVHSPDISLMVAPAIHEMIKTTADELGIEYDEGFVNKEEEEAVKKAKTSVTARKILEKEGEAPELPEQLNLEETVELMTDEMVEVEEPPRKGIMSRRDK